MREYPLIESAPYCCFAASLESVLKRHGICNVTQYDIANYIGIVVLEDDNKNIPKELNNIRYTNDPVQVGLHIEDKTIPDLFNHFNIPLKETYISWNEISDLNFDSILLAVPEESDALLYFDFGDLYNEERNQGVGHTGLYVSMDSNYNVKYLSAGPRFIGFGVFSSEDFVRAIKSRKGGISIFSKLSLVGE